MNGEEEWSPEKREMFSRDFLHRGFLRVHDKGGPAYIFRIRRRVHAAAAVPALALCLATVRCVPVPGLRYLVGIIVGYLSWSTCIPVIALGVTLLHGVAPMERGDEGS